MPAANSFHPALNCRFSRIKFAYVSTVVEIESAITNLPKK